MSSGTPGQPPTSGCPLQGTTLADPRILAQPNDFYRALREEKSVYLDPKLGMYLVSRHEDIQTVLRDPITFSAELGLEEQQQQAFAVEMNEIIARDGGGIIPNVVFTDPPKHTRIRSLMEKAFTAHRVNGLEPTITDIAVGLIERFANAGQCEGMKDFAVPMTIQVICEQLGVSQFDADKIQRWSLASTARIGRMGSREEMLAHARDICDKQNYLIALVRERQGSPREDMISDLIQARLEDGSTLTFEEVMSITISLLTAGNETTTTAMGNMLFVLATQPELATMLYDNLEDNRILNRFVEELLRIEPPVRGMPRMTTREVELGGSVLPKGGHLLLLFAAANDDEAVFQTPRSFDLNRNNTIKHVSFGGGAHRCVGAALARAEIKIATREIVRRLDQISLAVPADQLSYLPTVATRTIAKLPLTFKTRAGG
jgi:cytochrome P450